VTEEPKAEGGICQRSTVCRNGTWTTELRQAKSKKACWKQSDLLAHKNPHRKHEKVKMEQKEKNDY
jgi:hypothetical protein